MPTKEAIAQAAEAVLTLNKQYRAVLLVGGVLKEISDLEAYRANSEAKFKDAQEAAGQAVTQKGEVLEALAKTQDELAKAKHDLDEFLDEVKRNAELISTAKARAAEIVETAHQQAAAAAEVLKKKTLDEHQILVNGLKNEHEEILKSLAKEKAQRQEEIDKLNAELGALKKRLGL